MRFDNIPSTPPPVSSTPTFAPLPSNGFSPSGIHQIAGFPLPVVIGLFAIALMLIVAGAVVVVKAHNLQSAMKTMIAVVLITVGLLIVPVSQTVLSSQTGSGPSTSASTSGFAAWAKKSYKVTVTDTQAAVLLAGNPVSVEYNGARKTINAELAGDGEYYLFDNYGELPADPAGYGLPVGILPPGLTSTPSKNQ